MAQIYSEKPIVKIVMLKGEKGADGEEIIVDQHTKSGLGFWIGTQAEYDAIPEAELIENCVYYITDDTRDDFRTDLNALDTKVDNNYTDLDARVEAINENLLLYNGNSTPKDNTRINLSTPISQLPKGIVLVWRDINEYVEQYDFVPKAAITFNSNVPKTFGYGKTLLIPNNGTHLMQLSIYDDHITGNNDNSDNFVLYRIYGI